MEFTYQKINVNNIYVYQSIYMSSSAETYKNDIYYYLYNKNDLVYLGVDIEGSDSIIYYPYYHLYKSDTLYYNFRKLDDISGLTSLIRKGADSTNTYVGTIAFIPFYKDPRWEVNNKYYIDEIKLDSLVFKKEREDILYSYPKDYVKPIEEPVNIFMP